MERLRTIAVVAFIAHGVEQSRRPLLASGPVDIATVDVIARLHLSARRAGLDMVLYDPAPGLAELLELAGLAAIVQPAQSM